MNDPVVTTAPKLEQEFVIRRMQESFPEISVLVPVLFALGVVLLIALFRRERRLKTIAWGAALVAAVGIPYCILFTKVFTPNALALLVPFVAVGLIYVGMMYYRDAQSVHPLWASFLGLCRCFVYAILAIVFLLPGCQSYDRTETLSRVLVLIDVSASMGARDAQAATGQASESLPTRQDQVIDQLTRTYDFDGKNKTFVEHLLRKSPVVFYRFGGVLDKEPVFFTPDQKTVWTKEQFAAWLKPDKKTLKVDGKDEAEKEKRRFDQEALIDKLLEGTDIGGPALEVVQREAGTSNIQAVLIFSDGQRNKGGDDAVKELVQRASNAKRPIRVITVGVGDYRQPVRIRMQALRAPASLRPDDGKFQVRVPVFGDGLQDQKFKATLKTRRTKDKEGKAVKEEAYVVGEKTGQFKAGGEHPYDEVEFEVDLEALTGVKAKEDPQGRLQGTWEFTAEIPRHPREAGGKEIHVNDPPTPVQVIDKRLRVLLVASGPNRDYQFARRQFSSEVEAKRMELSIYLQAAGNEDVNQDVEGERLLTRFPDRLGKVEPEERYTNLKEYDVILAFDVDWMKVIQTTPKALELLKEWVGEHSGGLIFVGGPVYTDRLARPSSAEVRKVIEPLFALLPVKLSDSVLAGLRGKKAPDRTRPFNLNFPGTARGFDFLKLDEESSEPLAGWSQFFWGTNDPQPGKQPRRGFFSYHPVEEVSGEILATVGDPDAPRIDGGKQEMPYMVLRRYDKGKTFYVGSGELWRLRPYKEAYYERFLTKLVRFVSSGAGSSKAGKFYMGPEYVTGNIPVDAEVLDKDGNPLRAELKPEVTIIRPAGFDPKVDRITPDKLSLDPKREEGKKWRGLFSGSFNAETTGQYTVKIDIAGAEPFTYTFNVIALNVEKGNLRTNFDHLYKMSSPAAPALERLDGATKDQVRAALDSARGGFGKDEKGSRLFFRVKDTPLAAQLIFSVPPEVNSTKGKLEDLWDKGTKSGLELPFNQVMMIGVGAIGLLTTLILFVIGRRILATGILIGSVLVVLGFLVADWMYSPPWAMLQIEMSFVLGLIVGLLCVEWLTRKLLKLA